MKVLDSSVRADAFHPASLPSPHDILAPVYDAAADSSSLVAHRHAVRLKGKWYEIPKFLLLGQRGGGKPIRVGIFAGLDASAVETSAALGRLLLQFEMIPALAKDFALFGYPVVNPRGVEDGSESLRAFEQRYAQEGPGDDVAFFHSELANWRFDGLLTLRVDEEAQGFHATSRSAVLGKEVVLPALQSISKGLPIAAEPLRIRRSDRPARLADQAFGKLTAPVGSSPYPFEIEVFAPKTIRFEERITGLFVFVQEALRNYRRVISHAQNI